MKKHSNDSDEKFDKSELNEVQQNDWKDKYLRALADYQNIVRRSAEESKEIYSRTEKELLSNLVPIADLFDEVLRHDQYKHDHGLKAVRVRLADVLQGYGVTSKPVVGTEFDPRFMECIDTREPNGDEKENYVVEALLPLYLHRGQLYRPAKVIVAKRKGN